MSLKAIDFDRESITLSILDQLLLPYESKYIDVTGIDDGFNSIKTMQVRGAPAIAIVGVFSVVVELNKVLNKHELVSLGYDLSSIQNFKSKLVERIDYLITSRPTAVNLSNACNEVKQLIPQSSSTEHIFESILKYSKDLYDNDLSNNYKIGKNGTGYMLGELSKQNYKGEYSIMTICNTGALATSGHGTALGIVRSAWEVSKSNPNFKGGEPQEAWLNHVFPLETRPYNQGARLTAYELVFEKIPSTLITDSMATYLISSLQNKSYKEAEVKFVIVGADRVVKNGDTANKIGTFQLAVLCKQFGIKFIVAAPKTTIDLKSETGAEIIVEERPKVELTTVAGGLINLANGQVTKDTNDKPVNGKVGVAAPGINVWNPSFDVTPHELIDAIVTEDGVAVKENGKFNLDKLFK